MDRIKLLLREPALLIDTAETLLLLLVAFGLGINGDQETYIIAAIVALVGLVKGFTTSPFPVSVVPDFGRAALVLAASFGLSVSADQIAIAVTFLGTVMTLLMRSQITPKHDPVTAVEGSGAGPVKGEAGEAVLSYVGGVIALVAIVVAVLVFLDVLAVNLVALLVAFLLGVVLWFAGGRVSRY